MTLSIYKKFLYTMLMNYYPEVIPVFPLSGVIYFPKTNLPLNIFEQRYLNLVNDAYKKNKLMGMVQSKKRGDSVYNVGCLGKISDYKKNKDGRILINLIGVTRFEILNEKVNNKLYREFKVNYKNFENDVTQDEKTKINSSKLIEKTKLFFKNNGFLLNWQEFEKIDQTQMINTLSMISPITNEEKQKLLETLSLEEKIKTLENIVDFYLHEVNFNNRTVQ